MTMTESTGSIRPTWDGMNADSRWWLARRVARANVNHVGVVSKTSEKRTVPKPYLYNGYFQVLSLRWALDKCGFGQK